MMRPGLPHSSPQLQSRNGGPVIRRITATLLTLLVAAAVLVAAAPADARTDKMALGVSQWEGNQDIQTVRAFETTYGRKPAIWTLWSTWGDPRSRQFPKEMVNALLAEGVAPMIWWEPMTVPENRTDCTYSRHRQIARGKFDRYIKRWARAAKAAKGTILLRYAHEINGAYFPWTVARCGNTVDAYKKGWRHVYNTFRKVGATNVKFVWTVARKSCRPKPCNPHARFYPGNKYVQFAGFSSFNWGAQKSWKTMEEGVSVVMKHLTKFTQKKIIIAELASNSAGGDKPQWIRDGYPAVYTKYPQVKGVVYLNVDLTHVSHPDWSLNTPSPGAKNAYRDVLSDPRFQGKLTK
jgi:beta-mannanase